MIDLPLAIEVNNLIYRYPDGTIGLSGVNWQVPEGVCMGLIGANGAGKSTLLMHLNGLLHGSGDISILGMPPTHSNLAKIRQQVGLVFQNPDDQIFMPTVADEVAFAPLNAGYPRDEIPERVTTALELVGIGSLAQKHPANLSIGQKKRVALASVLVTDNRLLLLDEPSAGLDPAGRRALIKLLVTMQSTTIIASHDLAMVADLCMVTSIMKDGKIHKTAPTPEILDDAQLLADCGL